MSDEPSDARLPVLRRLQQPAYTGENRCLPCTVVNVLIAAAVSAVLATVWLPAGVAGFAVATALIYLRGYLVPGTPTLTKRYLPEPVLRLFGKADFSHRAYGLAGAATPDLTTGQTLLDAGVAVHDADGVHLDPAVAAAMRDELDRLAQLDVVGGADTDGGFDARLATAFAVDVADVSAVPGAPAYSVADRLLQWESTDACLADVALGSVLAAQFEDWDDLELGERVQWLAAARACLDRCPTCDGEVAKTTETPKTCCRDPPPVLMSTCTDCNARLLERPVDELAALGVPVDALSVD